MSDTMGGGGRGLLRSSSQATMAPPAASEAICGIHCGNTAAHTGTPPLVHCVEPLELIRCAKISSSPFPGLGASQATIAPPEPSISMAGRWLNSSSYVLVLSATPSEIHCATPAELIRCA